MANGNGKNGNGNGKKKSNGNGNGKNWIQAAHLDTGAFTKKAKAHGKSVPAYASEVMSSYKKTKTHSPAQTKTMRQASLSQTFAKMRKKKSKK